ncbi:MAG: sialidase family protein [Sumerlaeia bacterium]
MTSNDELDEAPKAASNGADILVVWSSTWEGTSPTLGLDWDILFKRSEDGGNTWTSSVCLYNNDEDDLQPEIAHVTGDTYVVGWFSMDDLGGRLGSDADLLYMRTEDKGMTWSDPAALNSNANLDSAPNEGGPELVADQMGDIGCLLTEGTNAPAFAWSTNSGMGWLNPEPLAGVSGIGRGIVTDGVGNWMILTGGNGYLISTSGDNGVTWSGPVVLPVANAVGRATLGYGDGVWGLLGTDPPGVFFRRSSDQGSTWSAPVILDSGSASAEQLYYDQANECWIALWNSQNDLGGPLGADTDILIASSSDGGQTWSAPIHANEMAPFDEHNRGDGSVSIVPNGYGGLLLFWRRGGADEDSDIYYSKFGPQGPGSVCELAVATTKANSKNLCRGGLFEVASSQTLSEFRMELVPIFDGTADVTFFLQSAPSQAGPWTMLYSQPMTIDQGRQFYSPGLISQSLITGEYYAAGVCWAATEDARYFYNPGGAPSLFSTIAGQFIGGFQGSMDDPLMGNGTTTLYSMELRFE